MGSHTGTHVDAPLHFEPGGAPVDALPLDILIGPARLVELDVAEKISRSDIDRLDLRGVIRILFKTRNCRMWKDGEFHKDYVYIARDAAARIVELGVRLVGVDYLSVESFSDKSFSTHHTLLRAGVVILEGLNPSAVPPGDYDLIALPLRLEGCDGAPARVVLKKLT